MEFFVFTGCACIALLGIELSEFYRAAGPRRPAAAIAGSGHASIAAPVASTATEYDRAA
jgi:hypothetical protein